MTERALPLSFADFNVNVNVQYLNCTNSGVGEISNLGETPTYGLTVEYCFE